VNCVDSGVDGKVPSPATLKEKLIFLTPKTFTSCNALFRFTINIIVQEMEDACIESRKSRVVHLYGNMTMEPSRTLIVGSRYAGSA
jgi:hypothetical protein